MPKTTISSERARELGRRGAAAVDRGAGGRFVKRDAGDPPSAPPVADPPEPPPVADPPAVEPAPSFRMARSLFGRRRRESGR